MLTLKTCAIRAFPVASIITPAMKIFSQFFTISIVSAFLFSGFKNAGTDAPIANSQITLFFDNMAGSQDLRLDDASYTNSSGESFSVSELQYFISNIRLRKRGGTEYAIQQDSCYFLVQESEASTQRIQLKVPEGEYDRVSFVLGVDSVRNTMDISKRTGVLDPASSMDKGMYWGWNSGYIFLKIEGNSAAAPADPIGRQKFRYHIGGFGGYSAPTINNIKTISLDLTNGTAKVDAGKKVKVHVKADILSIFDAGTRVSIAAHPSIMFSEYSVNIANNYSQMFSHLGTEN